MGVADKCQDKLQKIFPGIKITVTDKADAKFLVVSATSICAKVMRHLILYLLIGVYITGKHIFMYLCVSATKIM